MMNSIELKNITRTNAPVVKAPSEFQKAISDTSKKYVNLYAMYTCSNEIKKSLNESNPFVSIIRNRIENLTVDGLNNGSVKEVGDVKKLIYDNAKLQPHEERAIIEAYKQGIEEANAYIYLFFSSKVYKFMKKCGLIDRKDIDSSNIYNELQLQLLTITKEFDVDKIKTGGLCKEYINYKLSDCYRDRLESQSSGLSYHRSTAMELKRVKKITEENPNITTKELIQKYHISKCVAKQYKKKIIAIEQHTYESDEIPDINDAYNIVIKKIDNKHTMEELYDKIQKKHNITKSITENILKKLLVYADAKELKEDGRTRKITGKEYVLFADSIDVKLSTVKKVIKEFVNMFSETDYEYAC